MTLTFLALWHGHHIGYLLCFSLEFIDMECEKIIRSYSTHWKSKYIKRVLAYAVSSFALFYACVAFEFLHWRTMKQVYDDVYWCGHLAIAAVVIGNILFRTLFGKKKSKPAFKKE